MTGLLRFVPSLAWRAWFTPPPARGARHDQEAMARFAHVRRADLDTFEMGDGPLVLALHGWGGRPAQMAAIATALAGSGHRVVVPALPGHAGGHATDVKQVAGAIRRLIDEVGMPEAIVAHSFAAAALRLAVDDVGPSAVGLVAPLHRVSHVLDVFGDQVGLSVWVRRSLRRRLERWDPELWQVIDSVDRAQLPGAEILIVHDPADPNTPFGPSAELAALRSGTELVPLDGLGHNGPLSDERAIAVLTDFVVARTGARSGSRKAG